MIYDFNSFSEKHKSRYETIINLYRELFNRSSLHNDYITLCANQTNGDGTLSEGSELSQLLKEDFLSPEQFYGIDTDAKTIELNLQIGLANWVVADVYSFIVENISTVKPSIVNLDTVFYSKRLASNLLSDTLLFLTDNSEGECLVSLNVMVNNSYETHTVSSKLIKDEEEAFINQLQCNYSYKCAVKDGGWLMQDRCYLYSSTGKTVMCTYIFYRD